MDQVHNVVIIGSGPSAYTAAIYTSRANLSPVVFEGFMAGGISAGGQLTTTTDVENYPAFPDGILGPELVERMRQQCLKFGAICIPETVVRVDLESKPFKVWLEDSSVYKTKSIIIATGATAKRLNIKGEKDYWQAGISACAVCDGSLPLFRNKPIAVVGGGDSAVEEALYLCKYASKVYVVVRTDKLRASKVMADRLLKNTKVQILWNTTVEEALGDGNVLQNIRIKNKATGEESLLDVSGLFYAIGHQPNTEFLKDQPIELDSLGYIVVKSGTSLTNIQGVFACGDVQDSRYRQAITACGTGCMAALDCERYLTH